ncbi:MAG: hypothetical protein KGN36_10490 [Acidobacteriota bacterium]|nr:hypothetical protein [Acidobacteriota bacterium]
MTPSPPSPEQEFHTWGEIAGYLGISIREAQNREKSDGLPVRRIGEGKKPRVFALRSELDAWKLAASGAAAAPVPAVAPGKLWTRRAVLGAAGVAVAGMGAGLYFTRRRPRIEHAVLTGSLLTALDGLGRTIWEHRFSGELVEGNPADGAWQVQVLDLEGAGEPGVVVTCNRSTPGFPGATHSELAYVGSEGRVRWTLPCRPDLLDIEGRPFEPEWVISHVLAVPAGKQVELWVAAKHLRAWPGCILRVDPHGRSSVQLANAGHVEWLCLLPGPGDRRVAVCGENNAYERSFGAVVGVDDPPSSSAPGGRPERRFANGPTGTVRDYILFPTTEMLIAEDSPYGDTIRAASTRAATVLFEVRANSSLVAELFYEFSSSVVPLSVTPSGGCGQVHNRLEREGKLDHSWAQCPELRKPLTIRHWKPTTGWREELVPWRGITPTM